MAGVLDDDRLSLRPGTVEPPRGVQRPAHAEPAVDQYPRGYPGRNGGTRTGEIELGHDHPSPFQEAQHRPMALDSESTVLINGAAGGVGHLALQLAKWKGARVIAVASGAHETFLRELGADEFIDYTKERPEEVVRDVDLVLDTVGGPDSRRFLRTLKRGGSLYPVYFGQFDAPLPWRPCTR